MNKETITMGHGSGGKLSHRIYNDLVLRYLGNPELNELDDSAMVKIGQQSGSSPVELALSTDSYVIKPIFFPGGDIAEQRQFQNALRSKE